MSWPLMHLVFDADFWMNYTPPAEDDEGARAPAIDLTNVPSDAIDLSAFEPVT